jgi:hypothetical protein
MWRASATGRRIAIACGLDDRRGAPARGDRGRARTQGAPSNIGEYTGNTDEPADHAIGPSHDKESVVYRGGVVLAVILGWLA